MIKILIIEDKHQHFAYLNEILDPSVYEIHFSHDKQNGIEISGLYPQDIVFFHFEGMHDLKLLQQLLSEEKVPVPVIVVSSQPSFEEQRSIMSLGAEDYIPEELLGASIEKSIRSRLFRISRRLQTEKDRITEFGDFSTRVKRDDHILVKIGTKLKLIKFADIVCIMAYKEYTKIKTMNAPEVLIRKSMRNWVKLLPKSFLRIHRSTIVNVEYIEKISCSEGKNYKVTLRGIAEPFDLSYRYSHIMRHTFPG